ncbi:hypothetical protein [Mesonia aestuariivivens]|uniref:Lipoprotein n=1 Tax=Mesonia aestuariivivens TaxID=2796128 RepID=A0ABS6W1B0_9FLAO|nr:hypothetical protein [Mesonia aestuariivivens]MBW2961641.1 hypothetical protein [Mesonia aestuariivivens]
MKKVNKVILYVFLILTAASCSMDDNSNLYTAQELVSIDSVNLPDTLNFREIHDFEITYKRPTDCHFFDGFSNEKNENERIIWVVNRVYYDNNTNCQELENELITKKLSFEVIRRDYYIFKFWQGVDEEGENIYLTKEVPVKVE